MSQRLDSRISLEMPHEFRSFAQAFLTREALPCSGRRAANGLDGQSVGTNASSWPGLVPAIQVLTRGKKDVDARHRSSPSASTRHRCKARQTSRAETARPGATSQWAMNRQNPIEPPARSQSLARALGHFPRSTKPRSSLDTGGPSFVNRDLWRFAPAPQDPTPMQQNPGA